MKDMLETKSLIHFLPTAKVLIMPVTVLEKLIYLDSTLRQALDSS